MKIIDPTSRYRLPQPALPDPFRHVRQPKSWKKKRRRKHKLKKKQRQEETLEIEMIRAIAVPSQRKKSITTTYFPSWPAKKKRPRETDSVDQTQWKTDR